KLAERGAFQPLPERGEACPSGLPLPAWPARGEACPSGLPLPARGEGGGEGYPLAGGTRFLRLLGPVGRVRGVSGRRVGVAVARRRAVLANRRAWLLATGRRLRLLAVGRRVRALAIGRRRGGLLAIGSGRRGLLAIRRRAWL